MFRGICVDYLCFEVLGFMSFPSLLLGSVRFDLIEGIFALLLGPTQILV